MNYSLIMCKLSRFCPLLTGRCQADGEPVRNLEYMSQSTIVRFTNKIFCESLSNVYDKEDYFNISFYSIKLMRRINK